MTQKQREQYERMLETAKRASLQVVGHGTRKSDGAAIYAVPSRSEANRWHLIAVDGLRLTCDCPAAQFGKYCGHRAAVRARLELESQVRQDARERDVERAFHEAARELDMTITAAVSPGRPALTSSPKPRDDTRVFSVFK
jgi:hypothetical protein